MEYQKWEYLVVTSIFGDKNGIKDFNKIGQDGWELIQIISFSEAVGQFYFKRPA